LRVATGMRYAYLNPILEELVKEGRIKMTVGKQEDLVSLIGR
jgi:predicted alternative tryptophan synthase beta-subunit